MVCKRAAGEREDWKTAGVLQPRLQAKTFNVTSGPAFRTFVIHGSQIQHSAASSACCLVHECCSNSFKAIYTHDSVRLLDLLPQLHIGRPEAQHKILLSRHLPNLTDSPPTPSPLTAAGFMLEVLLYHST